MRTTLLSACAAVVLSVGGCSTFDKAGALDKTTLDAINGSAAPQSAAFQTVDRPYLLGTPVEVRAQPPEALRRDIVLVIASPRPLREIASLVSAKIGIPIDVEIGGGAGGALGGGGANAIPTPISVGGMSIPPPPASLFNATATGPMAAATAIGASSGRSVAVSYHGSCSGLLDYIAARAGVSWKYDDGRIVLYDVESKTFEIPALAWKVASKGSIVASAGPSSSGGSGGSSAGGSSGSTGGSSIGSTEIDNSGEADVWKNIQKVAETVTGGARVLADPSLGSITVTGTPAQIHRAEVWVRDLSASLTKEVAIEVHVYTIKLNEEQNYGFSPTIKFNDGRFSLTGGGASIPVVQGSASPLTFGGTILTGPFNGTSAMVQALATLGTVTQNYEQTAVTLNGQPVPIQVGQQTGYLASTSTTQSANVGSTESLTPGFVTTGFTGLFVPRVAQKRILLGMNITISSLLALTTESNGNESIQVPTTANSTFQQSVSLESGSTLLLTGFKNNNASTTHNGVFSSLFAGLGGGADTTFNRQLIAIVINARTL
ncbi:MAG: hypothetical protein P4L71_01790 [Acetobacteraceae bacterium]|nr:hypothetical protein [Acetobacteraceae bacterium]